LAEKGPLSAAGSIDWAHFDSDYFESGFSSASADIDRPRPRALEGFLIRGP
jgi:hypothetical protein